MRPYPYPMSDLSPPVFFSGVAGLLFSGKGKRSLRRGMVWTAQYFFFDMCNCHSIVIINVKIHRGSLI